MTMAPKLFQPTNVGPISLNHRVVLAPLTRFRASKAHIPHVNIVKEYYEQRAHTPGTLLITEATYIAERAGGYDNVPGIWNQDQIDAWKEITSAVHAKGSYMFCQLWALGRAADPKILASEGLPYVSASDVGLSHEAVAPRPLTVEEIQEYVELYAQAARNAISAGFDGVEIHGANGYLLDQFTQDVTNKRTDVYGGRISNRVRFPLEVVDAVASAIGPERVGYRISPWNNSNGMTMVDPKPTFGFLASQLKARQPRLAYLHVVEPRMVGLYDRLDEDIGAHEENDFIRRVWSPKSLISAGGYNRESAIDTAENKGDLIGFGRHFIANPDLVYRLERDIALNAYNRKTFYLRGETIPTGYTDYPFAEDYSAKPLL
ncbi:NADH:flavin oxidoreductase/NADH oxidase [Guyanagaster necrorhizus]|uniref:NADH:flavin oxidoreductase/NADH oxidase n=1 Tax=Guyanagaster necrorhizus TaxID=856835 RepID=A0A9P7W677_9AGAR|nr:NADH:flavin oxidoreductase/NADH oxidase [Guyanagaster necrorhizus MCA 3950]KAG7453220.1 NADH:flavin oxidoreductase/NADH oxidase [Guyanagaster necrorhizus MCA 3950]